MKHYFVEGTTLPSAYNESLGCLIDELDDHHFDVNGFVDCTMTIKVHEPFAEPRISKLFPGGARELEQYRQEMLDGILDFEVEAGKWHYTYHQRYDKWINDCIIPELKRDSGSRRAVISVRDNWLDAGDENPACLQHMQFMIRDGALNMNVLFRSNDAVRAAYMNMFALTELQKKVADTLDIPVGEYEHTANSYHCYPESIPTLIQYFDRIYNSTSPYDTAYKYNGNWDKLMESERPAIADQVKVLREQEGLR